MITIVHTSADGTVIEGTQRGDGTNAILAVRGWRWSRSLGVWFISRSRDAEPAMSAIETTVSELRAAGHEVTLQIDASRRPTAVIEADLIDRQADRVTALAAKAQRLSEKAEAADAHATSLTKQYPLGQPILLGHHSAPRMVRDIERQQSAQERA